ncbi:MAG: metal-dependent transcriptional regulator [Bacilli bacterium]|jgi:Mn-dependent DtxR family transcriptional regulator
MKLSESLEMYLETILVLAEKQPLVRAIDISESRGYAKSSVHKGLALLKKKAMIEIDERGAITFTPEGKHIAQRTYRRHLSLSKWLMGLGVPEKIAEQDACRIEHIITETTYQKLRRYFEEDDE